MRQCPVCGGDLQDNDLFCLQCGTKRAEPVAATEQNKAGPTAAFDDKTAELISVIKEMIIEPAAETEEAVPLQNARSGGAVIQTPSPVTNAYQPQTQGIPPDSGAPASDGRTGYAVINPPRENDENEAPCGKFKPFGAWAFVGYSLLFSLPIAGLIFSIVFSLNDENRTRRSYARSWLIRLGLCAAAAIFIVLIIVIFTYATRGAVSPTRQF